MEYVTLNTGAKMPLEGFGVFQIPDAAECEQVVYNAIKTGYRLLDTAASYGNEEALGKGVKRAIADGLVTREELFITTKVWITDMKTEDSAYEAVKTSLQKLDMPYVDLVLLHQAMGDYFAAYRGITKAYKEGLTKAIGVSNFYPFVLVNLCANVEVIQSGGAASLLPAGRCAGCHEGVRHCAAGMGPSCRRKARDLQGSAADRDRCQVWQDGGTGRPPLEYPARCFDPSEVRPCGAHGAEPGYLGFLSYG